MIKNIVYILIVALYSINFSIYASEPVILEYSDTLIGEQDSTTSIRRLVGSVRLRQGDVRLTCDNAIQYLNSNKYDLKGNVVIKQNTLTLKSPTIHYDGNTFSAFASGGVEIIDRETKLTARKGKYSTQTLIAEFEENVVVEDDSVMIYSDFVKHNRNNRISNAWGRVLIEGKYTNALLIGDSVVNIPAENYSVAFGSPKLLQIDSVASIDEFDETSVNYDTLTISSSKMEAFRQTGDERYIAIGSVEIIRQAMNAKAGRAIYFKDKNHIFLEEMPIVWYDSTQLFADTIDVYLKNDKLELLKATSKAFSVSLADTSNLQRLDQLSGDRIDIIFEQDSLKNVFSIGDAKSLYFISTENEPDGLISVSADKINIEMSEGKAENIIMTNQVPGEYLPEPLIKNREKEYYLPGFKYDNDKPMRIKIEEFEQRRRK